MIYYSLQEWNVISARTETTDINAQKVNKNVQELMLLFNCKSLFHYFCSKLKEPLHLCSLQHWLGTTGLFSNIENCLGLVFWGQGTQKKQQKNLNQMLDKKRIFLSLPCLSREAFLKVKQFFLLVSSMKSLLQWNTLAT